MKKKRFPDCVSEASVRAAAGQVFALILLAAVLRFPWLALLVAVDFALRVFAGPQWSFLSFTARKLLVPLFGIRGDQIPYAPKRFAAAIGLSLSAAAFVLALIAGAWVWIVPLAVLWLFSGLEAFLGFCAGCRIYGLLMRWHIVPEHDCPQCVLR
jgi:hypothetical protein